MLNDKPPPSRMPSFSNPFRRLSKTSRRASKEDASKIGPTNTASSSQTQPHSQTKTEILTPGPTASLLTALHTSILATPPSARLEYIETLQKLLHTISLCPELTTTIIPKSEYESDALIPCSIFQDRALEYIAEGAKRDRLTVVFVREEGCEFCKVVEAASRDVYGTPYSTRPHTPSHESRPSDPLSRPRERESCTSSSSSSAYTIPLNGRRSTPPYTTSTNKLKPPLTLSSTGTSSRSTSSYIAPRHQGIRTPSYSSSYYSNFPAAASKPGSARCSTSARTSAARRRKGS